MPDSMIHADCKRKSKRKHSVAVDGRPPQVLFAELIVCAGICVMPWRYADLDHDVAGLTHARTVSQSRQAILWAMNLPDLAFKASAGFLGIATLVLGADLVSAMTREALFGKAPVRPPIDLLCDTRRWAFLLP